MRNDRGIFDTFPLSLITTQTIHRLGESVGANLIVQRFRPNILVEAADAPFPEDDWMGEVLRTVVGDRQGWLDNESRDDGQPRDPTERGADSIGVSGFSHNAA